MGSHPLTKKRADKRYRFYTAAVFTDQLSGGNPLAVFPEARGLKPDQMRRMAREFNLSETVFVFPAEQAGHAGRLRIFTPGAELPFAGHPTVGTAHVLAMIGQILLEGEVTHVVFEEGIGPVPVAIHAKDGRPVFAQLTAAKLPEFGPQPPSVETIAAVLSLDVADVLEDEAGVQAASCGVPFLFVPVRNRDAVRRARVNRTLWEKALSSFWAPHLYVFAHDPELDGSDLRARMFAPAMGIEEDPATGSAATALAGYLGVRADTSQGTLQWVVEQGFEIGRPSLLHIEADTKDGEITEIRVGGSSVLVSEGTMVIPEIT
jgi:trans-2,3-dihydro-3-hydroxyanthranilate isomerase